MYFLAPDEASENESDVIVRRGKTADGEVIGRIRGGKFTAEPGVSLTDLEARQCALIAADIVADRAAGENRRYF